MLYLLYLAIQAWRTASKLKLDNGLLPGGSARRYFLQGLFNNLANPKMIAFFIALFPQFIELERGSAALQSLLLGVTLAAMAVFWIGLVVLAVGVFRSAVATSDRFLRLANRLAAGMFVGLAARLAFQRSH